MEPSSSKNFIETMPSLPQAPRSLHEIRVASSSVRVEPGRYRVFIPPAYVIGAQADIPCYSTDEPKSTTVLSDKVTIPEGSFIKSMEMMPTQIRKRYFSEDDDGSSEIPSPKKFIHDPRDCSIAQNKKLIHTTEKELLVDVTEETVDPQYEEDTIEVIEGEPEQDSEFIETYNHNPMCIRSTHNIGLGNVQIIKQLRGENNYLKDQLELSCYRIKQLEQLLVDRNTRLQSLFTENVQLGVKLRKLKREIGEDTANDLLNQDASTTTKIRR